MSLRRRARGALLLCMGAGVVCWLRLTDAVFARDRAARGSWPLEGGQSIHTVGERTESSDVALAD